MVLHAASGRSITYAALAPVAAEDGRAGSREGCRSRIPKDFEIVGKSKKGVDTACDRAAASRCSVSMRSRPACSMPRWCKCPVISGTLKSFDDAAGAPRDGRAGGGADHRWMISAASTMPWRSSATAGGACTRRARSSPCSGIRRASTDTRPKAMRRAAKALAGQGAGG